MSTRWRSTRRCCGSGERSLDRAYQDPRVSARVNDGRAFLEQTKTQYDLIFSRSRTSLTLVSGASSLRLEATYSPSKQFNQLGPTLPPVAHSRCTTITREHWLINRLAGTLDTVFGHPP
jgi:hypothetical protein